MANETRLLPRKAVWQMNFPPILSLLCKTCCSHRAASSPLFSNFLHNNVLHVILFVVVHETTLGNAE